MQRAETQRATQLKVDDALRVVHISPHVGGGVGSVLKDFFNCSQSYGIENHLFCLDVCKSNLHEMCSLSSKRDGIWFSRNNNHLLAAINDCDAVLIHYWNHPLMAKLLASVKMPRQKSVFWIHNSGLFEPHIIPDFLIDFSRKILFTSECSFEAPNLKDAITKMPDRFGCVHSTRSLVNFLKMGRARKINPTRKSLLYVGTVSTAKMHEDSAGIFAQLSKLGFEIRIVGGPSQEILKNQVVKLGGSIEVFGEKRNVLPFLRDADIFIYPLRPDHYGTGEQAILEAMAARLPVVTFDNAAERTILRNAPGGLVKNTEEFISKVVQLSHSIEQYQELSSKCYELVEKEFEQQDMTLRLVDELKRSVDGGRNYECQINPYNGMDDLELYALNSFFDGKEIISRSCKNQGELAKRILAKIKCLNKTRFNCENFSHSAKGTPLQYQKYLAENRHLDLLCKTLTDDCVIPPKK